MIRKPFVIALLLSVLISCSGMADSISFTLDFEFSGATSPAGPAPWLTIFLDDGGTPGSVKLILENSNLVASEYTNDWYLNLDPMLDPVNLSFEELNRTGSFGTPGIGTSANNYKADGDGYFDILFDFDESLGSRFEAGESIEYLITGIPTLTVHSFYHYSAPGGGNGHFHSAAHVGAICTSYTADGSGWIGNAPEPTTMALLGIGGLVIFYRKQKRIF